MLIDLDEDRCVTPGRYPRRTIAPLVAVLVALLAPALCGGGAVAARPALVPLASVPARGATAIGVTPRDLYVARDDPPTVSGYALPGGRRRWRVRMSMPVTVLRVLAGARVLLASEDAGGTGRLVALDSSTGAVLWSRPGASIVDIPAGGRALLRWPAGAGTDELGWVLVRTGRPVWSRPVPRQADVGVSHAPDRSGGLLVTDADGAADLLAEDTGAVLASGQLGSLVGDVVLTPGPAGGTPAPSAGRLPVQVLGGQFLVAHRRNAGTGWLTGFDMNTLARRWTITGDLLGESFPCGQLLCLGSAQGIRAVDGTTGAVRWSTDRWQYAGPLDGRRLLAYGAAQTAVLDAYTGRLLWLVDPQWTQLVLADAGPGDPARPALLRRPDARRPDRYWLAPLAAAAHPVGYVTGVDWRSCAISGDLLACRTRAGRVAVWRYPVPRFHRV
ncbi:MAG: hypothetical protein V7603_6860 [Micromonosporaceae bacterium]